MAGTKPARYGFVLREPASTDENTSHLPIYNYNCNGALERVFCETAVSTNLCIQMEFSV
jgi:hypothetical protein